MSRRAVDEEDKIWKLEKDLKTLQDTFRQLTEEDRNESYDMRRSQMLKAQIVQLERQCMLLTDALSSRASTMIEIENELISVTESLQGILARDTPGPNVSVSRKQLISQIQSLQKLKGSVRKQSALCGSENLRIPQLSGIRFCKSKPVSCLDVCSGKIDHINLQHVAYLESSLVALLKRLSSFQSLLQCTITPSSKKQTNPMPESYLLSLPFKKLLADAGSCVDQIELCCRDLLTLSLLHPSAPWSVTKTSERFGLFEPSDIYRALSPALSRNKEIKAVVSTLCKAHNYLMHVNRLQLESVKQEIVYSNQVSSTYLHYMNCLLEGVMKAYSECEENLSKCISVPVGEIFDSWNLLKSDQTDKAMRRFMTAFKKNENALGQLLETGIAPSSADEQSGLKVLRSFGVELQEKINSLKRQYANELSQLENEVEQFVEKNENEVLERMKKTLFS